MKITHKWWDENIQPRLSEKPNLFLESDLIEFGAKALDRIEVLESSMTTATMFLNAALAVGK